MKKIHAVYLALNRYRLAMGMTMTQFAVEVGLGMSTTRRALLGTHHPHDRHAHVLVNYYKKHSTRILRKIREAK